LSELRVGILIVTVALIMSGCADLSEIPQPADVAGVVGAYRIGVDDRVQVTVWRNPELTVNAPVRPDGRISVPLIGDVEAGGHTPAREGRKNKRGSPAHLVGPHVTVNV